MNSQHGSFILFCLVIISVLTSLTVASMQSSIQSSRLVHSYMNYHLAFTRAEVALKTAEDQFDIQSDYSVDLSNKPLEQGLFPALLNVSATEQPAWQFIGEQNLWLDEKYTIIQRLDSNQNWPFSNRYHSAYIIEKLSIGNTAPGIDWFRVTAKGFGLQVTTAVVLQVVFKVQGKKQRLSWRKIETW